MESVKKGSVLRRGQTGGISLATAIALMVSGASLAQAQQAEQAANAATQASPIGAQQGTTPRAMPFQIQEQPQVPRASARASDGRPSTATPLPNKLALYAGQAVVHRVPGSIRRVAVGNGEILSVHTVGSSELVLIGTQKGATNVHLWMADGTQRDVTVDVSADSGQALAETVRVLLGVVPGLTVTPVGGNVVVAGSDLDEGTIAKVGAIQKLYPQVLNFASTDPVGMRPMVQMDVQIMEFNRNALEELGIRWDTMIKGPLGGSIKDFTTNPYFRVLPKDDDTFQDIKDSLPMRLPGTQTYFGIATSIASSINLLMSQGKAWVLASPQLSVRSGGEATFLAGGEVPIVIPSVLGVTQVEFKEYGVRLNITPSVNSQNEVLTTVMAEVSRIDPSVSVQGVPGFLTRRTESEINVRTGETMVISGLIDSSAAKSADKFPILGDIPIIGKLFRSDGFRGQRTELVVFVTPRIVTPSSPENRENLQRGEDIKNSLEGEISKRQRKLIRPSTK
ncbi:type II and III secretion system protein family protein [Solilutibacter tolerans]|uniref:Pilus assembly protein CpaC n=1 Tax=Solilutibacter tolerans TaxID=1604334 RepID=A0A1N6RK71_9GAMM|nr:pilus assembly protein N-terminal domain-containing protein [Lysobacter tolerans]SIQ29102.1 pilus assembly protein CpaC [Lysobacter tolerans]